MTTNLLWHSNAPYAPTGYGNQTGLFVPKLAGHYDVAISAFYGLEGAMRPWNGIPVLPGLGGEYGNAYLARHAARTFGGDPKDGIVWTLLDVWVLNPDMAKTLNMACWTPVDHQPLPPRVRGFFEQSGAIPVAMSEFGREQLEMFDPLHVPHGVDTDMLKPLDQAECRETTGTPEDAFLVGVVSANKGRPSRKCFVQMFEAFAALRRKYDNAMLYLHTVVSPDISQGENLGAVLESLGVPAESVLLADQYRMLFDPYTPEEMATAYGSMDVLLNTSAGEGFGIPVLEAQACGVPAIVTDFSAMSEVCGSGWQVDSQRTWTPQDSWQRTPDVADIAGALEDCYRLPEAARKQHADKARKHALEYDVDKVLEDHLLPALKRVEERFEDRKPKPAPKPLKVVAQ